MTAAEILLDDPSGRLLVWPLAFAEDLVQTFDQEIAWQQDQIKIYGRLTPLPRLTAWYGDADAVYYYSGIRNEPKPWTDRLLQLKNEVERITGSPYNSMLANRYEHGLQYMGWHADDEAALGAEPVIASVSFGDRRRFALKHRHDGRRLNIPLPDGALLVMAGRLQQEWLHALPKTQKPIGLRINFTFRQIHQGKV